MIIITEKSNGTTQILLPLDSFSNWNDISKEVQSDSNTTSSSVKNDIASNNTQEKSVEEADDRLEEDE